MFGLLNAVPVEEHNLGGRSEPQCEHSYSRVTVAQVFLLQLASWPVTVAAVQVHIRCVRTSIGTSF